jgi:hypothetical protein
MRTTVVSRLYVVAGQEQKIILYKETVDFCRRNGSSRTVKSIRSRFLNRFSARLRYRNTFGLYVYPSSQLLPSNAMWNRTVLAIVTVVPTLAPTPLSNFIYKLQCR